MKQLSVFALIVLFSATLAAETAYTKRKNNYVREGPAAFYNLIVALPLHTALEIAEHGDGWVRVILPDKRSGWIAMNCLVDKKPAGVKTMSLENVWSSPKASRAGISAAIKGFAAKYGKTDPGNIERVLELSEKHFTPEDVAAFGKEISRFASENRHRITLDDLDLSDMEYDPDFDEQKVGVGIAARLVGKGIVDDPELVRYVNLIAASIAQRAAVYDWDFTVFVLDDPRVNGFAVPGGYILITMGAIRQCSDEAELAAIIAHEMGHVIRRHGLQEMTKRSVQIDADRAMAELDEETGGESEDEQEMSDLMEQMYERTIERRLLKYELEADRISALLCADAGYDPFGLVRVSEKVSQLPAARPDLFDPNYMAPNDARTRAEAIGKFCSEEFVLTNPGAQLRSRFEGVSALHH